MDINFLAVAGFYFFINIISFLVMMFDKVKSRRGDTERISEGILFFMAAAFGSVGVYLGMFVFHHKTRKWHFIIGIPLIMLQNIVFLGMVYYLLLSLV
jgi:uncharacterized membrane protein YsdA (DUF1294 family)